MLAPLNTLTDIYRVTTPSSGAGPAQAPVGYEGSETGLEAGQRVQQAAEAGSGATTAQGEGERLSLRGAFVVNGAPGVETEEASETPAEEAAEAASGAEADEARNAAEQDGQLSEAEQREVEDLRARDAEVRTHEQAHASAGGGHAGAPQFSFEQGPDGRSYAVDGEVSIDASPVSGDPQATIEKMQQVQRAALAPAEPSSQDRKVAAEAAQTEAKARQALASEGDENSAPEDRTVVSAPRDAQRSTEAQAAKLAPEETENAAPGVRAASTIAHHHSLSGAQQGYARLNIGDDTGGLYPDEAPRLTGLL